MLIHSKKKRYLFYLVIISVITITCLNYYGTKKHAASAQQELAEKPVNVQHGAAPIVPYDESNSDLKSALSNPPEGLHIGNLFQLGDFRNIGSNLNENSAKIMDQNPYKKNDGDGSSILQVTNATKQLGSIWGNPDAGNYIDVTHDQTLSMWLYFGNSANNQVGDGMAFVLQNDPRGIGAIATYHQGQADQRFGNGESLGVWATDFDKLDDISREYFAKTAIQNSFAIEFDTFIDDAINRVSAQGNSFDADQNLYLKGQHIAMGYPDSAKTYNNQEFDNYGNGYFTMTHGWKYSASNPGGVHDLGSEQLTDGNWHHITIQYNPLSPSRGKLTYTFNDKNLNGTPQDDSITAQNTIDLTHFHLKNNKLRWGFTGSTGNNFENNLIIFESVPSFVNGDVTSKLTDDTQGKKINKDNFNVTGGDDLTFLYTLKYLSGIKPWKNTVAKIDIPKEVTVNSIHVVYADGKQADEPINTITTDPENPKMQLITFNLYNPLKDEDPTNPTAKIFVRATANSVSQTTQVGQAHSRFTSQYLIKDVESPAFAITVPDLNLQVDQPTVKTFDSLSKVPNKVKVSYRAWERNYKLNSNIQIHYSFNSVDGRTIELGSTSKNDLHDLELEGSTFKKGTNTLTIYAEDPNNHLKTHSQTVVFNVKDDSGVLSFGQVSPKVAFQPINSNSGNKIVHRKGIWQIPVVDGRPYNTTDQRKNNWSLEVQADPLMSGNSRFKGKMIYRDKQGNVWPLDTARTIYSDVKKGEGPEKTEIEKSWATDQGILLKVDNGNNKGTYSGYLHWSLIDSISNSN